MRPLFFAGLLFVATSSLAQTGNYFLSQYLPNDERFDNVCYDQVQDERGVFYFATKAGVLEFDGTTWSLIPGNGAIYALEINTQGELFWGGAKGFGKVKNNSAGAMVIETLSDPAVKDVYQAIIIQDNAYFLNDEAVFKVDQKDTITTIKSSNLTGSFTCLFELFGVPYVSTDQSGIFKADKGTLISQSLDLPEGSEVIFCTRLDNNYLIGTSGNQIFRSSESIHFSEVKLQDELYAKASVVVSAVWVNTQLVALGTLRGGVIFVNPVTGRTAEIINYTTGLPDNEVYSLGRDKNQNIWVAHDYGFTRIAPYFPFRSFSHYPGLQGNLLCATSYHNSVYVGTSLGLFKLEKEDTYEDIVYYVDVEVPVKQKPSELKIVDQKKEVVQQEEPKPEPEKKKKGLFRFLKRNRDKSDEAPESVAAKPVENTEANPAKESNPVQPRYTYRKEKRTDRILLSSHFVFKKVKNIEAKVTQLFEINGGLYAAGLGGVFGINDLQSTPVLEEPIRFIHASPDKDLILASTYDDELRVLHKNGDTWSLTRLLADLNDRISFIFEGNKDELWLCGLEKIYRLEVRDLDVQNIQTIDFSNPNFNELTGIQTRDAILLATKDGFYQYTNASASFTKIDSLPKPLGYFASADNLWYRDSRDWNFIGKSTPHTNLQLLNMVGDIRYIAADSLSDNLWIITNANELFKFFGEKVTIYNAGYPLFLKNITNGDKPLSVSSRISIEEQSPIRFEVVQPNYSGQIIEYRYLLKGIDEKWSNWSSSNRTMDFPYLPVGQYTLSVQSRDMFGKIIEMNSVSLNVNPYFWRQSWFYAMEFAIFSLLVLLSFKLSVRYRFVSRLLSLLSIILLIEFMQTLIGSTFTTNTSPIIDFLIQVVVAFLVLPVEGWLRNLMFRSIDSTSKMYRIASEQKSEDSVSSEK